MRRNVVVVVLAVAPLGAGCLQLDAAGARGKCSVRGQTLARTSVVVVYERNERIRACTRASGRTRLLTESRTDVSGGGTGFSVFHLRAVGRFVAWEQRGFRNGLATTAVKRYDAVSGARRTYEAATDDGQRVTDPAAPHQVAALVLTRQGVLAWSVDNQRANPPRPEVFKVDADGQRMLDFGATVNRSSLTFESDGVLTWRNGSEARRATVRPE